MEGSVEFLHTVTDEFVRNSVSVMIPSLSVLTNTDVEIPPLQPHLTVGHIFSLQSSADGVSSVLALD